MDKLPKAIITASVLSLSLIVTSAVFAQGTNPSLKVITPQEGQTLYGDKIPVLFATENFEIVDFQTYGTNKAGQGHIHLWLDDANPTKDSATKVIKDTHNLSSVPYGEHTVRAELVNNNHSSLNPPQVTTVKFKNDPIASQSPAATSGFDKKTALVILVVVSLVIVAAWWYTKEEDEEPAKSTTQTRKSQSKKKSAKRRRK